MKKAVDSIVNLCNAINAVADAQSNVYKYFHEVEYMVYIKQGGIDNNADANLVVFDKTFPIIIDGKIYNIFRYNMTLKILMTDELECFNLSEIGNDNILRLAANLSTLL